MICTKGHFARTRCLSEIDHFPQLRYLRVVRALIVCAFQATALTTVLRPNESFFAIHFIVLEKDQS